MKTGHCVEIATFRLKAGVKNEELLGVERRVRSGRITSQPGYISRELGKDEKNGEWLLVMRFDTRQQMDAWMAEIRNVPEMREMGGLIEKDSMVTRFFTQAEA